MGYKGKRRRCPMILLFGGIVCKIHEREKERIISDFGVG
jgi:hypothetical protein